MYIHLYMYLFIMSFSNTVIHHTNKSNSIFHWEERGRHKHRKGSSVFNGPLSSYDPQKAKCLKILTTLWLRVKSNRTLNSFLINPEVFYDLNFEPIFPVNDLFESVKCIDSWLLIVYVHLLSNLSGYTVYWRREILITHLLGESIFRFTTLQVVVKKTEKNLFHLNLVFLLYFVFTYFCHPFLLKFYKINHIFKS